MTSFPVLVLNPDAVLPAAVPQAQPPVSSVLPALTAHPLGLEKWGWGAWLCSIYLGEMAT